jgi:hypothetical protein|tara:strand:+ start:1875 stop:2237 length:363 start_codon:yes stop_codon:yes gene_type:complete
MSRNVSLAASPAFRAAMETTIQHVVVEVVETEFGSTYTCTFPQGRKLYIRRPDVLSPNEERDGEVAIETKAANFERLINDKLDAISAGKMRKHFVLRPFLDAGLFYTIDKIDEADNELPI